MSNEPEYPIEVSIRVNGGDPEVLGEATICGHPTHALDELPAVLYYMAHALVQELSNVEDAIAQLFEKEGEDGAD